MRYEYAIYDILGWISGLVFNKWNFILVVPSVAWIAMVPSLGYGWGIPLSLLMQSLIVCGIVWGVSMGGKEYQNLYRGFLTQRGAFLRYTTIVTTIIASAVVAGSVAAYVVVFAALFGIQLTVSQTPQESSVLLTAFWMFLALILLSHSLVVLLLPLVLILQTILGAIVVLVSRQGRQMFRVSIIKSIFRYITITIVSLFLTLVIWSMSWSVVIFCGWIASLLITEEQRGGFPLREYYYSPFDELIFAGIILVMSFVLFVLARALIAVWGYRRSNTEGAR